jgi:hypothetical protein
MTDINLRSRASFNQKNKPGSARPWLIAVIVMGYLTPAWTGSRCAPSDWTAAENLGSRLSSISAIALSS